MNIALLSPSHNAYSETFIQAHKELLQGNILYYFSGELPNQLEGGLVINSRRKRIIDILKGHFRLNKFSLAEQAIITSFKKHDISIVIAEYGVTAQKVLPVCRELSIPLIAHFHGYDASKSSILEANNNYTEVFDYASFVIAVSRQMENDLLAMGCPREKLVYNVYGPRKEFFTVHPRFDNQQFISIGRFVNKKAPYYLILAFLEVVKRFPKAQLLMAGEGELLNVCRNLVNFYRLEENITFVGVISPEKFRDYLEDSIALIQHSITADDGDMEGTPLSILEASAAGLPIISTLHAGIPDVVQQDITGLLVQEHDVVGMAKNMIRLLETPALAKELGKMGKQVVKENFTLEKHIKLLDHLVEKAVNGN